MRAILGGQGYVNQYMWGQEVPVGDPYSPDKVWKRNVWVSGPNRDTINICRSPFSMASPDTILLASFSLDTPKSVIDTPGIKGFMGKYMTHWVDIPGI